MLLHVSGVLGLLFFTFGSPGPSGETPELDEDTLCLRGLGRCCGGGGAAQLNTPLKGVRKAGVRSGNSSDCSDAARTLRSHGPLGDWGGEGRASSPTAGLLHGPASSVLLICRQSCLPCIQHVTAPHSASVTAEAQLLLPFVAASQPARHKMGSTCFSAGTELSTTLHQQAVIFTQSTCSL